jgi:hypothetical protein
MPDSILNTMKVSSRNESSSFILTIGNSEEEVDKCLVSILIIKRVLIIESDRSEIKNLEVAPLSSTSEIALKIETLY